AGDCRHAHARSLPVAVALEQTHNGHLSSHRTALSDTHCLAAAVVHVAGLTADERLVQLDFAAEFPAAAVVLHGKADALEHEPCGLLCDADSTGDLVAADAVLAI